MLKSLYGYLGSSDNLKPIGVVTEILVFFSKQPLATDLDMYMRRDVDLKATHLEQ